MRGEGVWAAFRPAGPEDPRRQESEVRGGRSSRCFGSKFWEITREGGGSREGSSCEYVVGSTCTCTCAASLRMRPASLHQIRRSLALAQTMRPTRMDVTRTCGRREAVCCAGMVDEGAVHAER